MATKTFEELKQLATVIRDMNLKHGNTAQRVGTFLIDAINKIEEELNFEGELSEEITKDLATLKKEVLTKTEELGDSITLEKKERITAMTEANISVLCPTSGYKADGSLGGDLYDFELARSTYENWLLAQVGSSQIIKGFVLKFSDRNNYDVVSFEFVGGSVTDFSNWNDNNSTDNSSSSTISKSYETEGDLIELDMFYNKKVLVDKEAEAERKLGVDSEIQSLKDKDVSIDANILVIEKEITAVERLNSSTISKSYETEGDLIELDMFYNKKVLVDKEAEAVIIEQISRVDNIIQPARIYFDAMILFVDMFYNKSYINNKGQFVPFTQESESKTELDLVHPDYIFGINSGSVSGREYFTTLYLEGLLKASVDVSFEGAKKRIFQSLQNGADTTSVKEVTENIVLTAAGYNNKTIPIKYIRSNRNNAKNKTVIVLDIGDSITEQWASMLGYAGGWANFMKQFSVMDNEDIGGVDIRFVGIRNVREQNISYNDKNITCRSCGEGRSGWATYGYLNWSKWVRLDGAAYESVHAFIGAEAMYYALGLATKTPFDNTVPSQNYRAYAGSSDFLEIISTPQGRYKVDCNEKLWKALGNYTDFDSSFDYVAATCDPIIIAYLDNYMSNPDNPFYDKDRAQAYTGNYDWTYTNAMSIDKWLERYRTMDDLGVRLSGSAGQTVVGSDGSTYVIGTKVKNIAAYDVCRPTHVISAMGTNDMQLTSSAVADMQQEFLEVFSDYSDIIKVGYFLPRRAGVIKPQLWQEYGLQAKIVTFEWDKENAIRTKIGILSSDKQITYIPAYFTGSPISSSSSERHAYDLDDIILERKVIAGTDLVHTSAYWHRSVGYQCLAWLYWTLQ